MFTVLVPVTNSSNASPRSSLSCRSKTPVHMTHTSGRLCAWAHLKESSRAILQCGKTIRCACCMPEQVITFIIIIIIITIIIVINHRVIIIISSFNHLSIQYNSIIFNLSSPPLRSPITTAYDMQCIMPAYIGPIPSRYLAFQYE